MQISCLMIQDKFPCRSKNKKVRRNDFCVLSQRMLTKIWY